MKKLNGKTLGYNKVVHIKVNNVIPEYDFDNFNYNVIFCKTKKDLNHTLFESSNMVDFDPASERKTKHGYKYTRYTLHEDCMMYLVLSNDTEKILYFDDLSDLSDKEYPITNQTFDDVVACYVLDYSYDNDIIAYIKPSNEIHNGLYFSRRGTDIYLEHVEIPEEDNDFELGVNFNENVEIVEC